MIIEDENNEFFTKNGVKLVCQICGHDQFWRKETLMNTRGFSIMGWEFFNRAADNLICNQCDYVHWFFSKD